MIGGLRHGQIAGKECRNRQRRVQRVGLLIGVRVLDTLGFGDGISSALERHPPTHHVSRAM